MLDAYKELMPIVYGEHAIKYLKHTDKEAGKMCFSMHWHDRMELLRVISGRLELHLGEEKICVLPGQAAIIGPRTMHCGFAGEAGVEYHVVMFDPENFRNQTRASAKYIEPLCNYKSGFHALATNPKVIAAIDRLLGVVCSEEEENSLFAVGTIYEIIGGLYKYCELDFKMVYKEDEAFRAVLEYVNNHFGEHISAKDISRQFGYNETYFCRRFKSITGITVMKYIQILRMEEAQRLLRSTDEEIGSIAWECGYADISYFSNCFKRHCGYTPTQFRQKYRSR
ncbi:MAG: helix-turn-helix domain-containing protein [Lachnospiraceae bacterium]|nr:helix-turn-helix domain-containing protein [Lachnospiraceae bacterium]